MPSSRDLTAVSTFSGAGGSSEGYERAGFHVAWANEFIPLAAQTYALNHPDTILDTNDIRDVKAEDILNATGLDQGDIDLFDGSPPCASFSISGKRSKTWGQEKEYSGTVQRVDDLFFEYTRLLNDLQPRTFIAENVPGLRMGAATGIYNQVRAALAGCGYRVSATIVDAARLGVPHRRKRLIFVGVRADIDKAYIYPTPRPTTPMSVVLGQRARLSVLTRRGWAHHGSNEPFPTVQAMGLNGQGFSQFTLTGVPEMINDPETGQVLTSRFPAALALMPGVPKRIPTLTEMRGLCGFPPDYALTGSYYQRWERMGRAVPPPMAHAIAAALVETVLCAD